jgi:hypothetical protein
MLLTAHFDDVGKVQLATLAQSVAGMAIYLLPEFQH